MKINTIIGYNFNGISVNGRQKKKDEVSQDQNMLKARQAQHYVMQNWGRELDELTTQMSAVEIKDPEKTGRGEYLPEHIKRLATSDISSQSGRTYYAEIQKGYTEIYNVLQKKASYIDKKYDLATRSLEEIARLDELDRNNLLESDTAVAAYTQQRKAVTGIKNVGGYQFEMSVLKEEFIDKIKLEQQGQTPDIVGSILFFGSYGNGKTYITRTVAKETDCPINFIRLSNATNDNIIEAMKKIKLYAQKAQENFENTGMRSIIFIDEIDKMVNEKSPIKDEFEEFIKTCSEKYHCTVFAATNSPSSLGLNMKDKDVFPIKMSIDPADKENLEQILEYLFEKYPAKNIDYSKLAQEIIELETQMGAKFSNGQIGDICEDVCALANGEVVEQSDIIEYIKNNNVQPLITEEVSKMFQDEYARFIGKEK